MESGQGLKCDLSVAHPGDSTHSGQTQDIHARRTRPGQTRARTQDRLRDEGTQRLLEMRTKHKNKQKQKQIRRCRTSFFKS